MIPIEQTLAEIKMTYEKMSMVVVQRSGYDVNYVKRLSIFDFFDLFEAVKSLESKK